MTHRRPGRRFPRSLRKPRAAVPGGVPAGFIGVFAPARQSLTLFSGRPAMGSTRRRWIFSEICCRQPGVPQPDLLTVGVTRTIEVTEEQHRLTRTLDAIRNAGARPC